MREGHDPKMPTYVGSLELGSLSVIHLQAFRQPGFYADRDCRRTLPPSRIVRPCHSSSTVFWWYAKTAPTTRCWAMWPGPMATPPGPLWNRRLGRGRQSRRPPEGDAQPARIGGPVRDERQLLCGLRCFGGRAPLGDGHQSHAVLQYRVDLWIRRPAAVVLP